MNELESIRGVGPKTALLLNKLGINTKEDVLEYYPFRYEVITRTDITSLNQDDKIIIDGVIEVAPTVYFINRKLDKMQFTINTGTLVLKVIIFNRGFLKRNLLVGKTVTVIGKYDLKNNTIVANDIKLKALSNKPIIEPVYHTTYGLTSRNLATYMLELVDKVPVKDYIPPYLVDKYDFKDKRETLKVIHLPSNMDDLNKAIKRIKYEELFVFMTRINYLKQKNKHLIGIKRDVDYKEVEKIIEKLPFKLTEDQIKSIDDIYKDLTSKYKMNRLLQGDVGSGKTIVSFIALYINYLAGYEGALMAPTDVLANQHYNNFIKLFPNIKVCLLTGSLKAKEKAAIQKEIEDGVYSVIIGTHALITKNVNYNNLGLVITDEQHRFGVNQRAILNNKGLSPDVLYMSATPIPRTYALTLYGDMEVSNIKTMPKGRKEIKTTVESPGNIKNVLELMYEELKSKHQIYVVVPLIEESETLNFEDLNKVEENMRKAFGSKFKIGVMHGKLSNKDKTKVMDEFKDGDIDILISTTVIEVGVDVKNATMMVIFDAYRFGLSTLHQLRGRVGRNEFDSKCILISENETKRLNILTKSNDGFKIAEEDFKLRGSGDLFGFKQSGDMNFKIANIKEDYDLLLVAKTDSEEYLLKSNNSLIDEIINLKNVD